MNHRSVQSQVLRRAALPLVLLAAACSDSSLVTPDGSAPSASVDRPTKVSISPRLVALKVGETATVSSVVSGSSGTNLSQRALYRSTNLALATVSAAGLVTARAAGSVMILAEIGTVADTMRLTVAEAPVISPPQAFNGLVSVRFVGGTPSPVIAAAFLQAAARLNDVIQGMSGSFPVPINLGAGQCNASQPAINETVGGLLILASVGPIDGPGSILGQAGPCLVRTGTRGIPALGVMSFDEVDMDLMSSRGLLNGVVLHEMLHVLGIGTLWGPDRQALVADPQGTDPVFMGQRATGAYGVFGALNASLGVPVENTGGSGTRGGHWRESVFRDELMTGWAGGAMQMSALTVGALGDMGYAVDPSRADAYSLPALVGPGGGTSGLQAGVQLGESVLEPIARVDQRGKFLP
ncbi:MAG: Ig-like domain-containing protein [Gemmatimonadales bacterium]|nr:Ig-like domain-containing protein [Gemmatimonadales bacterium]